MTIRFKVKLSGSGGILWSVDHQFCKMALKKNKFMALKQNVMIITTYETKFYVFFRYATWLVTTEKERI